MKLKQVIPVSTPGLFSWSSSLARGTPCPGDPSPSRGSSTPGSLGCISFPPQGRDVSPTEQDGSARRSTLLLALPACTPGREAAQTLPHGTARGEMPRDPCGLGGGQAGASLWALPRQRGPLKAGEQSLGAQVAWGRCPVMHSAARCHGPTGDGVEVPVFCVQRGAGSPGFATSSRGCSRAGQEQNSLPLPAREQELLKFKLKLPDWGAAPAGCSVVWHSVQSCCGKVLSPVRLFPLPNSASDSQALGTSQTVWWADFRKNSCARPRST